MKRSALFALLSATALWGIAGPVIKFTLGYIPPFTFLTLRMLIASILVIPLIAANGGLPELKKEGLLKISALALLSQSVTLALVFLGYQKTTALEGTLVGVVSPILLLWGGATFLKEKITKNEKWGIILTLTGTLLIIFIEPVLNNQVLAVSSITGNLLVFASNLTWLAYVILEKKRFGTVKKTKQYHLEGMAFSFFVAFMSFVPFSIWEVSQASEAIIAAVSSWQAISGILYMGVFSSVAAYIFYDYGLSKVEASETGIFSYLQPIFTLPAAFILLGELPSVYMIPGIILIGVGFYISEARN